MEKMICKHCSAEYVLGINIGNFLHSKCPRCGKPFFGMETFDGFPDIAELEKVKLEDN